MLVFFGKTFVLKNPIFAVNFHDYCSLSFRTGDERIKSRARAQGHTEFDRKIYDRPGSRSDISVISGVCGPRSPEVGASCSARMENNNITITINNGPGSN